ncbi:MAG: DEAD/DEAH box helicase [Actinomycetota bacterium]|nr:DEAD/DEAH box helicase [Actinomycetota bacterium]
MTQPVDAAVDARFGFALDPFQVDALRVVDEGRSVLVAAPTGSGKTVVAEHALDLAVRRGTKAFYTSPIKALSNQKFADLRRRFGNERVGLLTGDNSINGDAQVVVMTTEVLRNMIYAEPGRLDALEVVILDEVHYLQDSFRGPVWEEVIIHLPSHVRIVALSATVSNAEELAAWISSVRGATEVVIERRRPVELIDLFMVEDRTAERPHVLPVLVDGRPNPEGQRFDRQETRKGKGRPRSRFRTPRRVDVLDELGEQDMLPAITFVFSRAGCDDAVAQCLDAGLRYTTRDERRRIRAIADEHIGTLDRSDLEVLGYTRWIAGLEAGIAAHHAGMVPPFKEAVEECFTEGLVKAVFATETLALGVNMPARSVVIEKLTKFTGEHHEPLTPGQYTQLTGRAGRRGLDPVGYAVVLWTPWVGFGEVAALAASNEYVLRSAFRPTYNMAANLVRRYDPDGAIELLNRSFAQFQADRDTSGMLQRIEQRRAQLERVQAGIGAPLDELAELRALRDATSRHRRPDAAQLRRTDTALAALAPGEVVRLDGRRAEPVAVLSVARRRSGVKVRVINAGGRVRNVTAEDLPRAPTTVGSVELPERFTPHNRGAQKAVARLLRSADLDAGADEADEETAAAAARLRDHPLAHHPDVDTWLRAAQRAERLERDLDDLQRRVDARTDTMARRFRRIIELLEGRGYLVDWELTARGELLAGLYHECDLLIAEAAFAGIFDDLAPAELAALASCLTYEHRSRLAPPATTLPSATLRQRVGALVEVADALAGDEEDAGLTRTRRPDPTFAPLAWAWAAGRDLQTLLSAEELSGGDFVRNVKQVIDLLDQLGELPINPATAHTARQASDALFRGVVSLSTEVGTGDDPDDGPDNGPADRAAAADAAGGAATGGGTAEGPDGRGDRR